MKNQLILIYGIACYLLYNGVLLYNVGFVSNHFVPKSIDSGALLPLASALLIDLGLIALFGLAHSTMAREGFKRRWTRFVPPVAERSTYVLQASLLLGLIMWQWRPLPQMVWSIQDQAARTLIWSFFLVGVVVVVVSTFLIDHLSFLGLQQVIANLRERPPVEPPFKTPHLYAFVRHPLQAGILMAYWFTPEMSVGHLLFAAGMTVYILIGLHFEERDLLKRYGSDYEIYRRTTPKLAPRLRDSRGMS